jgi:hypothetical protein
MLTPHDHVNVVYRPETLQALVRAHVQSKAAEELCDLGLVLSPVRHGPSLCGDGVRGYREHVFHRATRCSIGSVIQPNVKTYARTPPSGNCISKVRGRMDPR